MSGPSLNPMGNVYDSFIEILENITIKYNYKADEYETLEMTQAADGYLDSLEKKDVFNTYYDYTAEDCINAGIPNENYVDRLIIQRITQGETELVPIELRENLLLVRRKRVLLEFDEKNDYYRVLNGYPPLDDKDNFYLTAGIAKTVGISELERVNVPIHRIQDYFNALEEGQGDIYINYIENTGFLNRLINNNPDKEYLKYIGSSRIPLAVSRRAKNFQILRLKQGNLKNVLYTEFVRLYEACREYFMTTIYIPQFRTIIDKYDNFIALSIMVMTIQQLVVSQMKLAINREFFDIYAVRMLYECYGIPYNLYLDEDTQSKVVQNLNLFIQNKATNKGIYDVAEALGFRNNFSIYKYYLVKEHKLNEYGVPIFKTKNEFNPDTGEYEEVPDYKAMYDVYFHRTELKNNEFVQTFNNLTNDASYDELTKADSYWWEDSDVFKRVWDTQYNYIESKYLGLSLSYRLTNILFENILLLKLIINKSEEIKDVTLTLPKMMGDKEIPLFDAIIMMVCLLASKHNLTGEIVSIPTQIIDVLDYMQNTDGTYSIEYRGETISGKDLFVDTFSFNFDYFALDNEKGQENLAYLRKYLPEEDVEKLNSYISILRLDTTSEMDYELYCEKKGLEQEEYSYEEYLSDIENGIIIIDEEEIKNAKIEALNKVYENIKALYRLISYHMSKTRDKETYYQLKQLYRAAFYSAEMKDMFAITGEDYGHERVAYSFFEFLYYRNRKLYDSVFVLDIDSQYEAYVKKNGLDSTTYTLENFLEDAEIGTVKIKYDTIKNSIIDNTSIKDEKIYYYMNHIISRMESIVENINYANLLSDSIAPVEDLMIKMIRFFKSYTTELITLESIYICDMKPEIMIRFFDEIKEMEKTLAPEEFLKIPYSDTLKLIIECYMNDKLKLSDHLVCEAWYHLQDYIFAMSETIHRVNKTIQPREDFYYLADFPRIGSILSVEPDSYRVKDKIRGIYFTEDE